MLSYKPSIIFALKIILTFHFCQKPSYLLNAPKTATERNVKHALPNYCQTVSWNYRQTNEILIEENTSKKKLVQ